MIALKNGLLARPHIAFFIFIYLKKFKTAYADLLKVPTINLDITQVSMTT